MNAPSVDIKDILVAESSLGLTFATDLFVGREPAKPDNCVTVFDTPGFPPMLTLEGSAEFYYPSVQIRVRDNSYLNGWDLAQDIIEVLHGLNNETWNDTLYLLIQCSSGPALLDWDDNNRARFIINFNIQRR